MTWSLAIVLGATSCARTTTVTPRPYRFLSASPSPSAFTTSGVFVAYPKSEGFRLTTPDGQLTVLFPPGAIRPRKGEAKLAVSISSLDPRTLGSPPEGFSFDGNAYDVRAVYGQTRTAVSILSRDCARSGPFATCPEIVMRYASTAYRVVRYSAGEWIQVNSEPVAEVKVLRFVTRTLGIFVPLKRA